MEQKCDTCGELAKNAKRNLLPVAVRYRGAKK